jgi:hypothetical protein
MKKVIIAILLFSFPSILLSQDSELTGEQLEQFNRSKLSIDILTSPHGKKPPLPCTDVSEVWRMWQAYEGSNKISEDYFFSLTGYEFEARQAKEYHTTTNILLWGGRSLLIGGVIVALAGFRITNQASYQSKEEQIGSTMIWIGGGMFVFGIIPRNIGADRDNWAPVAKAEDIKNEYNEKLLKDITKE